MKRSTFNYFENLPMNFFDQYENLALEYKFDYIVLRNLRKLVCDRQISRREAEFLFLKSIGMARSDIAKYFLISKKNSIRNN
jgi:hypothetical protein